MIRSLVRLQQEDHGFRPDHVLTLRVPVGTLTQPRPTGKYDTRPRQMAYYREILQRVKSVPGVKAAAIVNNPPLSDVSTSLSFGFAGPDGKPQETSARTISSDYFAAMGIPLIAGRTFNDSDRAGAAEVAIINESLARQLFPNRNPLNRKLISASNASGPTIVGVVKDFNAEKLRIAGYRRGVYSLSAVHLRHVHVDNRGANGGRTHGARFGPAKAGVGSGSKPARRKSGNHE